MKAKFENKKSVPIITVFALEFKYVQSVGGSNNMDMNWFAAVAPEVVIELRLKEDDARELIRLLIDAIRYCH